MSTEDSPQAHSSGQIPVGGQPGYGGYSRYGAVPPPPPPPPAWPGYGQAWAGASQPVPAPRRGRRRGLVVTAGIAALVVAAGGTAWARGGSGSLTAAEIASRTDPGLVDITSTLGYQQATAEGTGMVLTSDGEVLTNNHVIAGATSITARDVGNGRTYTAEVVGYSDTDDVAVLRLVGASGLATVSLGNSSGVAAGQRVVALGNAEGKGGTPAVAAGSVTGTGDAITAEDEGDDVLEHLSGMIRTDANIEPGDSGGPLVDSSGQVIGMDTAASSSNSTGYGTASAVTTTAFAIPIDRAIALAEQITAGTASATVHIGATPFLGVRVESASSADTGYGQTAGGVLIEEVLSGTAAASAGLASGDTITTVGGHEITSPSQLQTVVEQYHPGDKVTMRWTDEFGQQQSATVTLTTGPTG